MTKYTKRQKQEISSETDLASKKIVLDLKLFFLKRLAVAKTPEEQKEHRTFLKQLDKLYKSVKMWNKH